MICPICGTTKKTLYSHVFKTHGLRKKEFYELYPDNELSDKEYSERMSKVHKDLCTDEYREMLSRIQIQRYENPDERKKLSDAQKIRWGNPIEKEKLRESLKELWKDPEYREKMSVARSKGAKKQWEDREKTVDRVEHIREAQTNLWKNPEYRENQCNSFREVWKDPEVRKLRLETFSNLKEYTRSDGSKVKMRSTYEVTCSEYLDRMNLKWEYEKDFYLLWFDSDRRRRYYIPDFYIESLDLFLEVKSDFYYNKGREDIENRIYQMGLMGHRVVLVRDKELKSFESFSEFIKSYGCADTLINSPQIGKSEIR